MGRNEDSLLRAAGETALASATRGGSCTHPDQSRGLVQRHNMRAISGVGASSALLRFFLGGGVALHERLVGKLLPAAAEYSLFFVCKRVHTSLFTLPGYSDRL